MIYHKKFVASISASDPTDKLFIETSLDSSYHVRYQIREHNLQHLFHTVLIPLELLAIYCISITFQKFKIVL
jgi:hypothetical protein